MTRLLLILALASLASCETTSPGAKAPQDNRNVPGWALPHLTVKHI